MPNIGILRISTPDGQVREHAVDFDSAILGRADGNQIVVPHVSIARRHCRLTTSGGVLMIEDLSSATGTAVNGTPLGPGQRMPVPAGARLQIGECEGTFRAIAPAAPPPPAFQAVPAAAPQPFAGQPTAPLAPIDDGRQFIRVTVTSPQEPIMPGSSTSATVGVQNRGPVVDEISIMVADLPPEWVQVTRGRLSLLPGAREEVTIVIRPPEGPAATAGAHQLTVVVTSRQHQIEVRSIGQFSIAASEAFEASMYPLRSQRDFTLTLTNKGNASAALTVEALDDEAVLAFEMPAIPPLGPGESRRVPLKVKRKGRKLFGKEFNVPFHVTSRLAGSRQAPSRVDGTLVYRPPLQVWKRPLLAVLLLAGLGGGIYGVAANCQRSSGVCASVKDSFGGGDTKADPGATPSATGAATAQQSATAAATTAAATAPPATVTQPPTPATTVPPTNTPSPTPTRVTKQVPAFAPSELKRLGGSVYDPRAMGEQALNCPAGHVLTGIRIGVGTTIPYVSFVEGECRPLTVPSANRLSIVTTGATQPTSNTTPESFNSGNVPTSVSCDPGWAVTGWGGRTGNLYDALQPICRQFAENGATAGTAKAARQIGGNGGLPITAQACPDGNVATGILVDKDPTGLFLFGLTCVKAFISTE